MDKNITEQILYEMNMKLLAMSKDVMDCMGKIINPEKDNNNLINNIRKDNNENI